MSNLEKARQILEEGKGLSCSLLQRRLKIDFLTARKLMNDLSIPIRSKKKNQTFLSFSSLPK